MTPSAANTAANVFEAWARNVASKKSGSAFCSVSSCAFAWTHSGGAGVGPRSVVPAPIPPIVMPERSSLNMLISRVERRPCVTKPKNEKTLSSNAVQNSLNMSHHFNTSAKRRGDKTPLTCEGAQNQPLDQAFILNSGGPGCVRKEAQRGEAGQRIALEHGDAAGTVHQQVDARIIAAAQRIVQPHCIVAHLTRDVVRQVSGNGM